MTKKEIKSHHQLNQPIEIDGRFRDEIIPPLQIGAQDFFFFCLCVLFCNVVHVYLLLTEVWASVPLS